MLCFHTYDTYQYLSESIMKFPIHDHLPEYLTPKASFQSYDKDQKSALDSVGICLIFSWHDIAQEQPNIKHITQPLASQRESSRLESPRQKRDTV